MKHEALILKYFNKTLSKDEENEFALLLDTNTDFKLLFEEQQNMQMAFKINEKDNLKSFLKEIEIGKSKSSKNLPNPKWVAFTVACCFIIGAFYFINKNDSPTNIYNSYFDVYPNVLEPIVRGETKMNSNAFIAYENKNYLDAEIHFNDILKENYDANIEFYYAMSLLNQNKYNTTQNILESLKTKTHDFTAEVYWYSALIAIKNEDLERAKKELNTLDSLNSNFKKEERAKLFKLLE